MKILVVLVIVAVAMSLGCIQSDTVSYAEVIGTYNVLMSSPTILRFPSIDIDTVLNEVNCNLEPGDSIDVDPPPYDTGFDIVDGARIRANLTKWAPNDWVITSWEEMT